MKVWLLVLPQGPKSLSNDQVSVRVGAKRTFRAKCPFMEIRAQTQQNRVFEKSWVLIESLVLCASTKPLIIRGEIRSQDMGSPKWVLHTDFGQNPGKMTPKGTSKFNSFYYK